MPRSARSSEFEPRKLPSQRRSVVTFDALVEACAWHLERHGFAATTTNHIAARAGVSIASLYEYFPGKDAIVAQVAERLVGRIFRLLDEGATAIREAPRDEAFRRWIELIHETVARERQLLAVFLYQVPYTNRLGAFRKVSSRLIEFSEELRRRAGGLVRQEITPASMQLIVNLVSSTILQLVVDPPDTVTSRDLLDELARRVEAWMR